MAQPPIALPIPSYTAHDLYNIERQATILEDLQEASYTLVLSLNSIVAGITTPRTANMSLPELIRPNANLAVDILNNINRLHSIFLPPVIQGQVLAGKNMNLERKRNIKQQRKTKRRRL